MKRRIRLSIKIIMLVLILLLILISVYGYNLSSVSNTKNNEVVDFEISTGDTVDEILNNLKEDNLIRNVFFSKIHIKLNSINNLQAGTYTIDNSKSSTQILEILNSGKVTNKGEIKITFPEGKTIRNIAKIIESKTNNKEEDVFNLVKDQEYIDSLIEEYWFISEDVKNKDLLFSLEGYLAMNTYIYKDKDVTVKDIFKKMLDYMDTILTKYKVDIEKSDFTIHEILTFSSIVQAEGRDFKTMNTIAGIFYNRLDKNMAFQSCPTNCYPRNIEPCTPNKVDKDYNSPYNTYLSTMAGKLPVGPISSFGEDAIKATIYPEDNEYLFFLSDINGKIYTNKTNSEHEDTITELKNKGLWF